MAWSASDSVGLLVVVGLLALALFSLPLRGTGIILADLVETEQLPNSGYLAENAGKIAQFGAEIESDPSLRAELQNAGQWSGPSLGLQNSSGGLEVEARDVVYMWWITKFPGAPDLIFLLLGLVVVSWTAGRILLEPEAVS